ncbi:MULTISPECIES: 3'-5' exoribonuclease domain-containing protein [Streptosporangium]|uniref:3'-5' exoribonuclease Rv2179c-like domain-containing protein n=1 Tax=Streptosporangium brasiliense TaxID=47480 RepID=A0ABT9RMW4_9ACTN|nr:3'-5' exoribonuclease [Streptosporangium brasiliense]MDP9870428.1 hypothetical protein [Streptosporangium brasiliense]
MKIWYDTEFVDTGDRILFISIGMVAEDGRELYRVSPANIPRMLGNPWLMDNVFPHLPVRYTGTTKIWDWDYEHPEYGAVRRPHNIADDVSAFIGETPDPELWAYYAAYDHVALAQLFGRMLDLPQHCPKYTNELQQEIVRMGKPRLPKQIGRPHHALSDAHHDKQIHDFLTGAAHPPAVHPDQRTLF